ncbi:MAG: RHS repeat-associated core domain-containing protein [Clostridia bacterium]|nr:RHS repeat-associated core domain-containing protein [Clostridia bacterium]
MAIYNESGSCVAQYAYNAWGEHTVSYNSNGIATMNPIRYRGYYYDTHTGLYYLQSRYYNPAWGRFISPDCYVSTGTGLLGYNMYLYCNNNPVMYVDPNGESIIMGAICVTLIIVGAVGLSSCGTKKRQQKQQKYYRRPKFV